MRLPRREFLQLGGAALAAPALICPATAQTYPSRPITMIIPFPPGGNVDVIGRILAERMRATLGQPVIVENIAGANGSIGVGRTARARPDGYTIDLGFLGGHVQNGALYSLQYDVLNDFQPISPLVAAPYVIFGRKTLPANDLKELIAWLKANPDKSTMGTAGQGSLGHVCGLIFQDITGTRLQFVPYRGTAPAMQDLVAGQIDLACLEAGQTLALYRAGSIKAFGVMNE